MKLLVFAHVPPPLHGQSQMVKYLVDGFRQDARWGIEVVHIDARLSTGIEDVGSARGGKVPLLLGHCVRALRARFRFGTRVWYLVPSPPKRSSLYRDWITLVLLRPWCGKRVVHWHAVGLGAWLEREARGWERWITRRLLGGADLAIVLSEFNRPDAMKLNPRRTCVVANGVPDPCPDFEAGVGARRRERWERLRREGGTIEVLFLAHCAEDKGVFDALEALALCAGKPGRRFDWRLTVAGSFVTATDEARFRNRISQPDLAGRVRYAGFVSGVEKDRCLREADVFLFPSYFANEGQPLNLIEAMAHGLLPVSTRWRGIPEMLPAGYAGLVEPRDPAAAAAALEEVSGAGDPGVFRRCYVDRYSMRAHLEALAGALRTMET